MAERAHSRLARCIAMPCCSASSACLLLACAPEARYRSTPDTKPSSASARLFRKASTSSGSSWFSTLNAISGIYIPENLFPAWLRDIAQVLPIGPLAQAMQAAFSPQTNGGRYFAWGDMLIVAAWGVAGTLYAVRRFRWTPSQD
jgi:hypothetical protein